MRKYLLVPGTGGVNFIDAAGKKASYIVELLIGRFGGWTQSLVDELSCRHIPPPRTPWSPTATTLSGSAKKILPGSVLWGSAYDAVDQSKYVGFAYDWRLDIRFNALELVKFLKKSQASDPGAKWSILTHSQGGLVACAASLLIGKKEWVKLVERVCLAAPPVMGTVNAMDAMIRGNNFGNVNSQFFQAAARTWPALFQMFPQYNCVLDKPSIRSTSASLWPKETRGFLDLLQRAKEYMAWLAYDPFKELDASKLMFVLGNNSKANTLIGVKSADDGPVIASEMVTGDTLVPFDETMKFLTYRGVGNRVLKVSGPYQEDHFRILADPRTFEKCDRFLSLP